MKCLWREAAMLTFVFQKVGFVASADSSIEERARTSRRMLLQCSNIGKEGKPEHQEKCSDLQSPYSKV